ncbi:MAG: energy-coupling factor ABC transporter ATP-binding protein [Thermoprotei archaeon]
MNEIVVEMKNVKYIYPDGYVALKNVNLRIFKGERIGILGPNGAGKSTLLMLINGLFKPTEGQVYVFGMLTNKSNLHKIRMKVGLVFQDPDDQLFSPTVLDDVAFGLLNMGLSKDEALKKAREALKIVGLEDRENSPPHHLSIGEKKKAAIATILAMNPEILILDEPTVNLDPKSKTEIVRFINKLYHELNITLIVTTHDVDMIPMIVDRVYILNKGEIIAEGSVREIFTNFEIMEKANLEPPTIARLFYFINKVYGHNNANLVEPLPLTIEEALEKIKHLMKF